MGSADLSNTVKKKAAPNAGKKTQKEDNAALGMVADAASALTEYLDSKLSGKIGETGKLHKTVHVLLIERIQQNCETIYNYAENKITGQFTSAQLVQLLNSLGNQGENISVDAVQNRRKKSTDGVSPDYDNAFFIFKCFIKDNALKPNTVADVKLRLLVPENNLIRLANFKKEIHAYAVKEIICPQIIADFDKLFGETEMKESKTGAMAAIAKKISEGLSEVDTSAFSPEKMLEKILPGNVLETLTAGGFNISINSLLEMLETSALGFQFIENAENENYAFIREYENIDKETLPDEHYQMLIRYFTKNKIQDETMAYNEQYDKFLSEMGKLWNLIEIMYKDAKPIFKAFDYDDLLKKNKNRLNELLGSEAVLTKAIVKEQSLQNETEYGKDHIRAQFAMMQELMEKMQNNLIPAERKILSERIAQMEKKYSNFEDAVNPSQLQPGFFIDLDICTVKRRKTSLFLLSGVLKEFLDALPGFFTLPLKE